MVADALGWRRDDRLRPGFLDCGARAVGYIIFGDRAGATSCDARALFADPKSDLCVWGDRPRRSLRIFASAGIVHGFFGVDSDADFPREERGASAGKRFWR